MSGIAGEVRWQLLTREDIRAAAQQQAVVIQPIGSIEQHGPHLPLDTDAFSSQAIAWKAAQAAPLPVLVTPTVWWGVSEYWMGFRGTLPLRPDLLVDLLAEIVGGIGRNGFRRVLLLNGHAGNTSAMHAVAVRCLASGMRVVGMNYWMLAQDLLQEKSRTDSGLIGHAGEIETALQLALRPETVRAELVPEVGTDLPRSVVTPRWAEIAIVPPHPEVESPTGVYGTPAAGRTEFGAEIVELATNRLVEFLGTLQRVPLPEERRG